MRDRGVYNDWEGFDASPHVFDERREKSYQARIWWCLGIVSLAIFIGIIVREIQDYQITRNYHCVKAEYENRDNRKYAVYMVGDVRQIYYLPEYSVKMDDGYVLLYYRDDIRYAEAVPTWTSWIPHQLFFGILLAVSSWKLWTIYMGKKHMAVELPRENG